MVKPAITTSNPRVQTLLGSFAARGRAMLKLIRGGDAAALPLRSLGELAAQLLEPNGDASAAKIAGELFAGYFVLSQTDRVAFLNFIADIYGPDPALVDAAIAMHQADPSDQSIATLRMATDSQCQKLIRRLNMAENGTLMLIRMREDVLTNQKQIKNFASLDSDFSHVFTPWFNLGFLDLRQMTWNSPASLLHKIITYEAVHAIQGWDDLRRRVEPDDRRCYAFVHPRMPDEPLIFVEVALTREIPSAISALLDEHRAPTSARDATAAVFYSISNCQDGLRGIPFGNILIKRVVELLSRELPLIKTFVTLSPVPGFAAWLKKEMQNKNTVLTPSEGADLQTALLDGWSPKDAQPQQREAMLSAAARYFIEGRTKDGKIIDPVARFHLGNGAQLERINWGADMSQAGLRASYGLMVNYLYDLKKIEKNVERFSQSPEVVAGNDVKRLMRIRPSSPDVLIEVNMDRRRMIKLEDTKSR